MFDQEIQFQRMLDGKLSASEIHEFEQALDADSELAARYRSALQVRYLAEQCEQEAVPDWDPSATFEQEHRPWWQWQGLPVMSVAFSVMAMLMVIVNVQFSRSESGFMVNFGDQSSQQQAALAARVDAAIEKQNQLLVQVTQDLKDRQQDQQMQLVDYLITTSREERKQDISDLIRYINDQRNDDYIFMQNQFRELQNALYYQQPMATQLPQNVDYKSQ